jgi:DnaJ-class molecular chaperone
MILLATRPEFVECPDCGGKGYVRTDGPLPWSPDRSVACPTCEGRGEVPKPEKEDE